MKTSKLVRVLLYLLFIGGNVAVTVSCNSTNCPLNNTVYSTYGFYAIIDGKEEAVQIQDVPIMVLRNLPGTVCFPKPQQEKLRSWSRR